jgi:AMMECR1 domain-containing protein
MSNGLAYPDKPLEQLIDTLFHWLVEKYTNIWHIVVDIITDIQEIIDLNEISNVSLQEYWLILITQDKSGVLLPDTKWISNISQALKTIKEKNWLDWNAQITKFKTDRIFVI